MQFKYFDIVPQHIKEYEIETGKTFYSLFRGYTYPYIQLTDIGFKNKDFDTESYIIEIIEKGKVSEYCEFVTNLMQLQGYYGDDEKVNNVDETISVDSVGAVEDENFYIQWERNEKIYIPLGVSTQDYWYMSPKRLLDVVDLLILTKQKEVEYGNLVAFLAGQYNAQAIHNPSGLTAPIDIYGKKEEDVKLNSEGKRVFATIEEYEAHVANSPVGKK